MSLYRKLGLGIVFCWFFFGGIGHFVATDFFTTACTAEDWTPLLLVNLCDHADPAAQRFGRAMITTHFDVADVTGDGRLLVEDPLFGNAPVDVPLETILGKAPRMTRDVQRLAARAPPRVHADAQAHRHLAPHHAGRHRGATGRVAPARAAGAARRPRELT